MFGLAIHQRQSWAVEWRVKNNLPRITASHTTNEFFRLCFVDPYPQNLNHIIPYHTMSIHMCIYIHVSCMYIHTYICCLRKYLLISIAWYCHICFSYTIFLNVIFHIFLSSARRWRIDKKPTSISEDVCIIARGWPLPTMPCTCDRRPSMGWPVQNIGFTTI